MSGLRLIVALIILWSSSLLAQERPLIEEIIVTAQRVEENAQKVPIALSAFDEMGIEDRQIIGIADLSLFVPNLSYNTNNVGDTHVSIRGVGSLTSLKDSEPGVSLHVNEIPLPPGQPPFEIFDLARIEVLRGPQGTLYGKNATGGTINLITHKPSFDGLAGYVDVEAGEHNLLRARGAINVTLSERFAFRLAGMSLDRDGYTDNLAGGQVPGVPSDFDGRDLYGLRASATWRISDSTEIWAVYERFDEDDDRMVTHNRRCKTALAPTTRIGCEPGEWGLEPNNPNQSRFQTSITNGLRGVIPLGARDAETGLVFRYPRPEITDLRDVHIDFAPVYEFEQDLWQLGASHDLGWATVNFTGSYQKWRLRILEDDDWSVGHELAPIAENPSGLYPVSVLPEGTNPLQGPVCNANEAQFGVLGGCVMDPNLTRQFWYSEERDWRDYYSTELRLRTELDGRVNFLIGGNYQYSESHFLNGAGANDYWEMLTRFGQARALNPADPFSLLDLQAVNRALILWGNESKPTFESYSAFSELYVDLTDRVKLTVAARYNHDQKRAKERRVGVSLDVFRNLGLPGELWVRVPAALYAFGFSPDPNVPPDSGVLDFYGLTDAVDEARAIGGFEGLIAANIVAAQVPLLTAWNEDAIVAGLPSTFTWDAFSGRAVLDWQATDDVLLYASYSRGYKPGGLNGSTSTNPTYHREDVNAFEIGMKSLLVDGSLLLNVTAFFNDYNGLQLANPSASQFTRSAENTNEDIEMWGAEVEVRWRPVFAPRAELELGYSWLNAEIKDDEPRIDPHWLTNGDPDYVELLSWATNFGSPSGRYVARAKDVLPWVDTAVAVRAAIGPDAAPATIYPNGIPAWFDGAFLAAVGVELQPGIAVDVSGNQIPDTPEHTLHLGASYTWDFAAGGLTARWDYYWQSRTYLTIFNRSVESNGSWDQHNASLIYESGDGRWSLQAWVRNLENDVHILGGYRQHSQQDFSVTEPRAWGASLRYNFGIL
jgi:outer membrane receptor protein involved in Fe transport